MKLASLFIVLLAALVSTGCGDESAQDDGSGGGGARAHSHDGPHGGRLADLTGAGHLEFVHDASAGTVSVHLTTMDAKTALAVPGAPQIKLSTKDGPKILTMTAVGGSGGSASEFTITDDTLKSEVLEGRIVLEIEGQTFNPFLRALRK
ncbi:MAG: hypothetical protein CMJ83_09480 [Planctomycetes bacterium]|nr:hypothetical protein [Planctomycetota bacterium]